MGGAQRNPSFSALLELMGYAALHPSYELTIRMNLDRYPYYQQSTAGESLPFALVDMDLLQQNVDSILRSAKGMQIRVASKSVRCAYLLKWLLAHHPSIEGVLCYHGEEAVQLSQQGFDDLLVAYPTVQRQVIEHVCQEIAKGKNIILTIDSVEQVELIEKIAERQGVTLPLCLDIDMSTHILALNFGVNRSPVRTVKQALAVYQCIARCRHVTLDGILGYEAQIAGVADDMAGQVVKNRIIKLLKRYAIPRLQKRRQNIVAALKKAGAQLRFVNGGGTGSVNSTVQDSSVTEITVGSGFYCPALFDLYADFHLQPAALFALEVTRRPTQSMVTCLGGGYVASGAVGKEKLPTPIWPQGLQLTQNEAAGEVQTPLQGNTNQLKLGDPVFFRHSKAGELCERFNRLVLLQDGKIIERVPTYRGEGWCFV